MKKLNCVLLIDDDEPTNFYNEIIIKEAELTNNVVAVQSGREALDYLVSIENGEHPQPDLIFLDINMPAMNGWEFMEAYKKLEENQKGGIVIIMLTTSLNPDDAERARELDHVHDFKNKPLSVETIKDVVRDYFAD